MNRYLSIWFRHLQVDEAALLRPSLKEVPFVIAQADRGRNVIHSANALAGAGGVFPGMVVADARAILPALEVIDFQEQKEEELLDFLAEWCLRYTPEVAVDLPEGLLLRITGCAHLWGGERAYFKELLTRLNALGYTARGAIADTVGTAWAVARYGKNTPLIEPQAQRQALAPLPPAALRLSKPLCDRLHKLGLHSIGSFIQMPRQTLRSRFGPELIERIDQALGTSFEFLTPIRPALPYEERLPCLEPVRNAKGIERALQNLLENICLRLRKESKGLRAAELTCYRIDGQKQQIRIGTSYPCRDAQHLFKLFALKIPSIRPALGIETFLLEVPIVERLVAEQEALWEASENNEKAVAELLDKITAKIGREKTRRYLPQDRHWPERSYKEVSDLRERPAAQWRTDKLRPLYLLPEPEKIEVSVPLPDYPPLFFRHKGKAHRLVKADGPERIECEWWLEERLHRDYYAVEDESGARYWLFRSGHADDSESAWYLHGFFA